MPEQPNVALQTFLQRLIIALLSLCALSLVGCTLASSGTQQLPAVSLSVAPNPASLQPGKTQQFTATVTGTANTAVSWSASSGMVNSSGMYTAPNAAGNYTVKATSMADTTVSASAAVTVTAPVAVTISPTSASLPSGGTQQFIATITGSNNTAVSWSATHGTISSSGFYTAPGAAGSYTVTATSAADTSKSASASVTVSAAPVVAISISPGSASLSTGGTQQFTATVTGSSNTAVNWSASGGSISSAGNYTAPATAGTYKVTATSAADSTKSASANVTVSATTPVVAISISPASASLVTSGTRQFTATVTGSSNTAVGWQVSGVAGGNSVLGTISTSGMYTAPAAVPSPATVTVTAVSQADTSKSASAPVTLSAPPPTTGALFYVANSGSNTNPGTISAPWQTIQHAASTVTAGSTVYVRAGTYNESVNIAVSGSATAGPVTFQSYPGETAIVDGTGLTPSTSDVQGLFNLVNQSYVTIQGFEIRNYTTSNANATPAGIWVTGSGSNIQLLNNVVHNITTTSEKNGNAFGIAVYGSAAPASLDSVTISGNQVYSLKTGNSETVNVDGNVTNFVISNNVIHDNDNIGIDAIGFEGVAPNPTYDYARNGVISGNTIYNISAINNPGEGNQYDADGIYCDGCSQVIIERNLVYNCDLNIEAASEHSGHVSSFVTIRNNLVYHGNSVGISIGGYASNVGGSDHITIVNNTLFENDTKNTGSGELQVQYYATNNVFENNIVYATAQGLLINNYTNSEPSPVAASDNLYFSSLNSSSAEFIWNGASHTGFTSYQSASGQDSNSRYADPLFLSLTTPNLQVEATSPAVNTGTNLGAAVEGAEDFAGNPRVQGSNIDIGAYEQ